MIYRLMRQDPSWRALPTMILVGAFLLPVLAALREPTEGSDAFLIADPLFFSLFFFLTTWIGPQQRDTRFQAGLPIAVSQVFWARVFSMTASFCVPLVAGAATIFSLKGVLGLPDPMDLLELAALFPSVILLIQFVGIQESRFGNHNILLGMFYGVCSSVPIVALELLSARGLTIWFLLSIILLLTIRRALPRSFEIPPAKSHAAAAAAAEVAPDANDVPRAPRSITWFPVLRSLFSWATLVWVPVLIITAVFAGLSGSWLFFSFSVWIGGSTALRRSHWLSGLPIKPRVLLLASGIPLFLLAIAGYFTGRFLSGAATNPGPGPTVEIWMVPSQTWPPAAPAAPCARLNVIPPIAFWRRAPAGSTPLTQSPWGETFQPPVVSVMGFRVYNPYATGCENSERFLDWQFERATTAAYGRSILRSEYQGPGHWIPPSISPPPRIQILNFAAVVELALLVMLFCVFREWYRFRCLSRPARAVFWALFVGVPFAAIVGMDLMSPRTHFTSGRLIANTLQWVSWALPESLPLMIVAAAAPVIVCCLALDRLFREAEVRV